MWVKSFYIIGELVNYNRLNSILKYQHGNMLISGLSCNIKTSNMAKSPLVICFLAHCSAFYRSSNKQDLFPPRVHIHTCCSLYLEYSFPRICMAHPWFCSRLCCFSTDPLSKEISRFYLLPFCHSPWPCSALLFFTAVGIFRNDFTDLFLYLLPTSSTKIQAARGQRLHFKFTERVPALKNSTW